MTSFSLKTDDQRQRFAYLCERFVADRLTETEGNELHRLLDADPAAVDAIREHLFLDLELKGILLITPSGMLPQGLFSEIAPVLMDTPDEESFSANADAMISNDSRSHAKQKRWSERSSSVLTLITVSILLISLAIWCEFRFLEPFDGETPATAKTAFHAIGRITADPDARFNTAVPVYQLHQRLTTEKIALEQGLLEMQLDNGVRMVLEGPGEVQLNSPMNTFCRSGRLSVFVPPEAKGFEVGTPLMSVRDLGTEFLVDVGPENTELHVVRGEVESNWLTKEWHSFTEGNGLQIGSSDRIRRMPADPSLFMSSPKVLEKAQAFFQKRQVVYDAMFRKFRDDGALIAFLDSDGGNAGDLTVRTERGAEGSLPNRKALAFQKKSDRVELSVDRRVPSLTLWASVRLERFDRANVLLQSERFYEDTGILWQLDWRGAIQFHQRVGRDTRKYDTPPVIGPEKEGVWLRIGVIVDAGKRTVSHYLNDRLVASLPYEPEPLLIGKATIGNEPRMLQKKTTRFWNGALDAFVILGRPADPGELIFE